MDSSLYSQWVSQTPEPAQQHHPQHHSLPAQSSDHLPNIDNWHKGDQHQSSTSTLPISTAPIDALDFAPLSDSNGQSNPAFYTNQYAYFMQPTHTHSPYTGTIPYTTSWNNPSTSLPVSKYSSLNGATTGPSTSQTPQQSQSLAHHQQPLQQSPTHHPLQPHPSTTNAMIIDPMLSANGTSSNGFSQSPSPTFAPHSQPQQPTQSSQPQRAQFYSPMMTFQSSYYRPHLQQPSQGTLSPQALHSPTTQPFMAISPASFYSHSPLPVQPSTTSTSPPPVASTSQVMLPQQQQPPSQDPPAAQAVVATPTGPTKEQREKKREQLRNSLLPFLNALTGAGSVTKLVDRISDYGYSDVDCELRMEILGAIRDNAGNPYYRAWSENPTAMEITREWLRVASKADKSDKLSETTMPLLHLIDRLPLTLEGLIQSKLAKLIKKLAHTPDLAAAKDMAFNLEQRWRVLINEVKEPANSAPSSNGGEDKPKKRKLSEPTASKAPPPPKKAALGTSTSSKPVVVKKETKPSSVTASSSSSSSSSAAAKDAKADSSFFSAPKAKAKLPSFTKKPVVVPKKEEVSASVLSNVAMPSSIDPFQEALKAMKTRKESPVVSTPPAVGNTATNATNADSASSGLTKTGKKKKTVTWAPEGQLESIRLIEKAVYDDDPVDGTHLSLRDLDRGEGAALHAHLFEETIDWAEPLLVELPIDLESKQRGTESEEKNVQERREQTALGALYMNASQIPDSPGEPPSVIPDEELDKGITTMIVGEIADAAFNGEAIMPPANVSVADLVSQLAMAGQIPVNMMDTGMGGPPPPPPIPTAMDSTFASLHPDQLQVILQHLQSLTGSGATANGATGAGMVHSGHPGAAYDEGNSAWGPTSTPNHFGAEYGHSGYGDETSHGDYSMRWEGRGRGRVRGRGRGRGGEDGYRHIKRKPCSFFAAGRCKYGDQCDFSHDPIQ